MKRLLLGAAAILTASLCIAADLSIVVDPEAEMIGTAKSGSGNSSRPKLSGDGRYVAFESTARLVDEDGDHRRDVYVYDRNERSYRLLHRPSGASGAGGATLSSDGQWAAYHIFEVAAKQGVEPVTSILLVNLQTKDTRRVPQPWRGESANGEAMFPVVNTRASLLAFSSNGPGLAGRLPTPVRQVYVFDRASDEIRLVTKSPMGLPGNRTSAEPRLSDDGRYVAYLSAATNLATELPIGSLAIHLYLADRYGDTFRIDESTRGFDAAGFTPSQLDMDAGADNIVFEARVRKSKDYKSSLENTDLFLFERSSMTVTRLTTGLFAGRASAPSISANGRWIVFALASSPGKKNGGVVVHDRERNSWRMATGGRCVNPAISGDGRWIAFESADPTVTKDKKNAVRVFVQENPSYERFDAADH